MKPSRFTNTNDLRIGNFVTFRLIVPLLVAVVPAGTTAPVEAGQTSTEERFERHSAYFSHAAGRCGQSDVALRAGPESTIFIANPLGGKATDSCLYVLDDGFGVAASGDDSDGKLQAQITFTPSALDTDNVRLTAYSRGRCGFSSLNGLGTSPRAPPALIMIRPGDTLRDQYFASVPDFCGTACREICSMGVLQCNKPNKQQ